MCFSGEGVADTTPAQNKVRAKEDNYNDPLLTQNFFN